MLKKSKSKIAGRISGDWPALATFRREHNHSMSGTTVLKHRSLGADSRQRLLRLFRHGHRPSSAHHCLKMELKIKHGDDYNRIAADTYYLPSVSVAHKLHRSECRKETGSCSGDLQAILSRYCEDSGGMAKFGCIENGSFVAVCSPLMARAHELVSESSKLVTVDVVIGRQDRCHCRMYSFMMPTPACMLPLGVIITNSPSEDVFEPAVCCLKSCLPEQSFFGRGSPRIFLIDSNVHVKQALHRVFDNSRVLYGHLHTLKAVWSWLCNVKNNIPRSSRQELYSSFRSVLYAETEADMINQHLLLVSSYAYSMYSSFAGYYDALWNTRSDWALGLLDGLYTTSYVEVTFWIWKDCILDRLMSFSMPQLLDFISSCFELYMEKRLLDFCNNRYQKLLLKSLIGDKNDIPESTVTAVDEHSLVYSVKSLHSSDEVNVVVDLEKASCSCSVGNVGKLCGHARALLLMLDESLCSKSQLASTEAKLVLFRVATGMEPPPAYTCDSTVVGNVGRGIACIVNGKRGSLLNETCSNNDTVCENSSSQVSNEEIEQFCTVLCMQMKDSMQKAPNVFASAFRQMRARMDALSTDAEFLNALCDFQMYTGSCSTTRGQCEQQKHSIEIHVRPMAASKHRILQ